MTSNHPIALLQDHWEPLGGTFPALRRDDRRAYAGTKLGYARPNEQAPADRRVLRTRLCIARSIIVTMIKAGAFGYGASWRIAQALKIRREGRAAQVDQKSVSPAARKERPSPFFGWLVQAGPRRRARTYAGRLIAIRLRSHCQR